MDLSGLGIVGHPATVDDKLVGDLVSPWNEDGGSFKTIGLAGEAKGSHCRQRCGEEGDRKDGKKDARGTER
jgi:hypothetical protein